MPDEQKRNKGKVGYWIFDARDLINNQYKPKEKAIIKQDVLKEAINDRDLKSEEVKNLSKEFNIIQESLRHTRISEAEIKITAVENAKKSS